MGNLGLNQLDYIILVVILSFAIIGLLAGLIKQIFGILAVIFGFVFSLAMLDVATKKLNSLIEFSPFVATVLCFLVIFFCAWAIIFAIGQLVSKIASFMFLGWLDKLLGAFVGLIKGFFVASILLLLLNLLPFTQNFMQDLAPNSKFYQFTSKVAPKTYNILQTFIPDSKTIHEEFKQVLSKNGKITTEAEKFLDLLKSI